MGGLVQDGGVRARGIGQEVLEGASDLSMGLQNPFSMCSHLCGMKLDVLAC